MYNLIGYFICVPVAIISIPSMGALKACKLDDYPIFIPVLTYILWYQAPAMDEVFFFSCSPRRHQQQLNSRRHSTTQSRLRISFAKIPEKLLEAYTRKSRSRQSKQYNLQHLMPASHILDSGYSTGSFFISTPERKKGKGGGKKRRKNCTNTSEPNFDLVVETHQDSKFMCL